ncbi:SAV_6107 family HEPN domain-containing protein [Streptomyces evansiae]|uniref:SAV_6107 family HEPN domain-containing protein n=2 Tax=Streptomyces TaxID=1883 RepID=UPI002886C690|nr:SAV_6107 family HEPN domain-containing protein [Streptomyces sp. DSM 41859]MDT0420987.1 SAV_6107 family HEPN domain-containing protein [Streptomyces sp. DSM 41859]
MAHTPSGDAATPRPESGAREEGRRGRGIREERGEPPEQLRLPEPAQTAVVPTAPRSPRSPRRVARQLAFPVAPAQPVRPGPRGPAARTPRPGERDRPAATRAGAPSRDVLAEEPRTPAEEARSAGSPVEAGRPGGGEARPAEPGRPEGAEVRPAEAERPRRVEVRPAEAEPPREEPAPAKESAREAGDVPASGPPAGAPEAVAPGPVPVPPAVIPRQPAPPGEDVHPVLRKAGAPPAARDLLERAREELAVARDGTGPERYAAAHRAALRAASAVLAVHGPPPGTRPRGRRGIRSAWEALAEAVPDLAPWTLLFTASAAHRARAEAGLHDPASSDQADELLRAAEDFTHKATTLLALPEPHTIP